MPRTLFSTLMLPSEGVYASNLPHLKSLPVRTFLPTGYEPNYAYPLIVFFHAHGGSDEQVLRLAPRISRRNCHLREPSRAGGARIARRRRACPLRLGRGRRARRTSLADYLVKAVEQTRREFHIHSERVYLAGIAEGAASRIEWPCECRSKFAGVIVDQRHPAATGRGAAVQATTRSRTCAS